MRGKKNLIRVIFLIAGMMSYEIGYENISMYIIAILYAGETILTIKNIISRTLHYPTLTSRMILLWLTYTLLTWLWIFLTYTDWFFFLLTIASIFCIPWLYIASNRILRPFVEIQRHRIFSLARTKISHLPNLKIIGISGSYGKSSVKFFLDHILKSYAPTITPPGNMNNEVAIARFIRDAIKPDHTYFICETGAYKKGEVALIWSIINHQYGFLTGLNNQHEALFWSLENAIETEVEIIDSLCKNKGTLYANRDNTYIHTYPFPTHLHIVRYGIEHHDLDAQAHITVQTPDKTTFSYKYKKRNHIFETDLIAPHMIQNLAWVIAFCLDQGVSLQHIQQHIMHLAAHQKTGLIYHIWSTILIDDSYNMNVDGVIAACKSLSIFTEKKKILIIDEIIELGHASIQSHEQLGEQVGKYAIDHIFLTGKNYTAAIVQWLQKSNFSSEKTTVVQQIGKQKSLERLNTMKDSSVICCLGRGTEWFVEQLKKSY